MKVKLFLKRLTSKYLTGIISVLFLAAIIPVTMKLVGENQDIRNRAAQASPHIRLSSTTINMGDTLVVTIIGIPSDTVFAMAELRIDNSKWEILPNFTTVKITNAALFYGGVMITNNPDNNTTYSSLWASAHNITNPISGEFFELRLKPKITGTNLPLNLTKIRTIDTNAHVSLDISETAQVTVNEGNGITPVNNPITPTVAQNVTPTPTVTPVRGPTNSISAPAQPTADAYVYQITVSLSANPRPTADNQGKTVRLVFSDSNSTPTTDMFFGGNAATIGTFTNSYTARFSLGRDGQQKKFWAIFHNDPRKNDGWSDPVSTGVFTFGPGGSASTPTASIPTSTPIPNTPTPTNIPPTPTPTQNTITPTPTKHPCVNYSTKCIPDTETCPNGQDSYGACEPGRICCN